MLSIQNVSGSGQASTYYGADNYYAKDSDEARDASKWHGSGAKELGLSGAVDPDAFKAILEGNVDGIQLGRKVGDKIEHRPGVDLTFSAPKSLSILALVGGDKRLVEAHTEAVKETLNHIEKNHLFTRVRNGRSVEQVPAGKMVAATFTHDTSRDLDPQLHTHSVVANMVQDQAGKWRSMDNSDLYTSKMFLGAMYRNNLAEKVHALGYGIERTHDDGRFDIAGVPKGLIKEFSQRSQQIEKHLEEYSGGTRTAKGAASAALHTRDAKKDVDRPALKSEWEQRTEPYQTDLDKIIPGADKARTADKRAGVMMAKDAVAFSMKHLSERSAAFTGVDLRASALHYAVGGTNIAQIDKEMSERLKGGDLIKSPMSTERTQLYTTRQALVSELRVIKTMQQGQGKSPRIASERRFENVANVDGLTRGQKSSLKLIATSKDFLVGVEGWAGVGKTFMMDRLRGAAEKQGWKVRGFSTATSQANTLQKDAGIESKTVASFVAKYSRFNNGTAAGTGKLRNEMQRTLLVVDEASLTSTEQARKFLDIAATGRAKVVMIGDTKQLGAVEAGKPFHQLQKAGMATPEMSEVLRQKNNPYLRDTLSLVRDGNIKVAFERHKDNIIQATQSEHVGSLAGKKWLGLPHHKRQGTLVVAQSRATRSMVSATIRDGLQSEGRITGDAAMIDTLERKDLTNAQRQDARNYREGDTVLFERDFTKQGVPKGQYAVYETTADRNGAVSLVDKQGELHSWTPREFGYKQGATSTYTSQEKELMSGDRVRWTYNADKDAGIVNTENASVKSVDGDTVTFSMHDGGELQMKIDDPRLQHFDYAFSTTAHASQGLTADSMIGILEATLPGLTNQQSLYVQLSRAKEDITVILDDKDRVIELLEKNSGEKVSALEALDMPYLDKEGAEIDVNKMEEKERHIDGEQENTPFLDMMEESNEKEDEHGLDI